MRNKSELSPSIPPSVQRVSSNLRWAGLIGFWLQVVLGAISAITLLVATPNLLSNKDGGQGTGGTGFGIFFAICGLIALGICIYFSFRFTNIARLLQNSEPAQRPSRTDTLRVIRTGLIVNLLGMLLTIIGAQAIVGSLLVESLRQSPGLGVGGASARFVLPIDLVVVQSNTNLIAAHFAGIAVSLWLLNRITR